jgi:hypothetical protein
VIFIGELGEILGFFVEHDLVNGEDGVLEGVESGYGFACGSARSGRFLCVGVAGCTLLIRLEHGRNLDLTLADVFGAAGSGRD